MINTEHEYKGYLLHFHRIGSFGAFTSFAMKLREPGRLTPPFAGRIQAGEFKGEGAKLAAYETIKRLVDEASVLDEGAKERMKDLSKEQIEGAAVRLPTHYYEGHSASEWENSLGCGESAEDSERITLIIETLRAMDEAARGEN